MKPFASTGQLVTRHEFFDIIIQEPKDAIQIYLYDQMLKFGD
jgi:hypothetical protein